MNKKKIWRVGIIQTCSQFEPAENLKQIREGLIKAKNANVTHVFLPEVFFSTSADTKNSKYLISDPEKDLLELKLMAKEFQVFLLGGSASTRFEDKVLNRTYSIDPQGNFLPSYDKIHLFRCFINNEHQKQMIDEGLTFKGGTTPLAIEAEPFKLGLSICFDLRFPELYRHYKQLGCHAVSISSAFTKMTGEKHWHTLVKARAIENQYFVFAANQVGQLHPKLETYGHSLIVDPWGNVLADAQKNIGLIWAEIDLDLIESSRDAIICDRKLPYM